VRRNIALSALLALLVLAAGAALAAGDPPDEGDDHARVHVIEVQRDAGDQVALDLDHSATAAHPAPDSIGDQLVARATFTQDGEEVGFDGVTCTLVRLPSWFNCVATNIIRDGSLTVQFLADLSTFGTQTQHFAITGGTGPYRGARGEVTFVATSDTAADVTFKFTTISGDE
jgi:hypothetical protein